MNSSQYKDYLKDLGILLDEEKISMLERYLDLLVETNKKMNLTAIKEPEEIWEKHFLDCSLIGKEVEGKERLIDIGTGAGFPGLVIKILYPELFVTLVDETKKKIDFLNQVKEELGLKKLQILHGRAEELAHRGLRGDVVTARAVSNLRMLVELCGPLTKMNGIVVAMKGPGAYQEKEEAENAAKTLGLKYVEAKEYELPESGKRINLIYQKYKPTPKGYPRRFAEIKKKPL